ncbi:cobaltochelatase subunit CobN [Roseomonas sp. OT10]|uniref:cobaltochelatase subunit CobN n=1 Tax=Roseomonas cutis TaxID=2897332 RepID=UPI001E41F7FA|nr:cobaltochelatase subunit CobN [Roseomonas sp. OT10]UFN47802.1 cobaltochelatase subunit CobN [Roseomonas sp. OT10]
MHLLVREVRELDAAEAAADLGQTPAPCVLLSFSDSDLGAAAAAWEAMAPRGPQRRRPGLRLASLARLRHPMSVDLYAEAVVARARCIVVRLLGGLDYWRYGAEEVAALCRREGIALALLPGDGREDARLRDLSTLDAAALDRLDGYFRQGGPANMDAALRLMAHLAGAGPDDAPPPEPLPEGGEVALGTPDPDEAGRPVAAVVLYRSHLLAGDVAPLHALAEALRARGLAPRGLHVASLKTPALAAMVAARLREWRPAVVLNATGFSARLGEAGSPLDAAGVPVLQLVLSGSARAAWEASPRGLSPTDLAMQVALPELDGRLLTTAIGFKAEGAPIPALEYARTALLPEAEGIALAADRAAGWARLAATPRAERRVAVLLSDYPGAGGEARGQVGQAVGLDSFASLEALLRDLSAAGYTAGARDAPALVAALCHAPPTPILSLEAYRRRFDTLPAAFREAVCAAWGAPEDDPGLERLGGVNSPESPSFFQESATGPATAPPAGGASVVAAQVLPTGGLPKEGGGVGEVTPPRFTLRFLQLGNLTLAVQPDRGHATDRRAGYHDPDRPPRHGYVAAYLWLREVLGIHALVHLGTHGTLEWLPGKAVALSAACAPAALLRGLPVVYPFIVNNPGEAAVARRRLGAVTIGHLTPPLRAAGSHGAARELERLIDEYAAADGLDRRRTALLRGEILDRAAATGLLEESGIPRDLPAEDALARLDAWLCNVKEMQIRDGLHVFGRAPAPERRDALLAALERASPGVPDLAARLEDSPAAERDALLAALDGRFVPPGPSGAPTRGRADVLPTGRNLTALDPRAVPTRSALVLAEKAGAELLRRHLQEQGEWPRSLVLDLWGSATLRTGGEELALALWLLGTRPVWDEGSARVRGVEVLPLATLDRPRVDVTLRVSGLFRDAFAAQIALFDEAVRAVAARDEAAEWNPLAEAARGLSGEAFRRATTRIYGAAPGAYGAGTGEALGAGREALGAAYLAGSAAAYGAGLEGAADPEGFRARVAAASAFLHPQDHDGTDLLDGPEHGAHAGGFAAAATMLGNAPALYHGDTSDPQRPTVRGLAEAIARVTRGRAANPAWIAGQMRHGYRGAAEIARAVEGLHGFAATLPQRLDRQMDLLFDATLGTPEVARFLKAENPAAHSVVQNFFADALYRGLWHPRRNIVLARLDEDPR